MQHSISHTGAASSTDPLPPNVRRAILTQLQVIRDTASSLPGADLLVAMTDIAAQLVHSAPAAAPATPEHKEEQSSERGKRGRKRPLTEPNALAEIMRYAARVGGRKGTTSSKLDGGRSFLSHSRTGSRSPSVA